MMTMRHTRRALIALGAGASVAIANSPDALGGGIKQATTAAPSDVVGVLMPAGGADDAHTCTASVVHSQSHDLVLTAGHCITGDGTDLVFVPKYEQGSRPFGTWKVTAAYADASWLTSQDAGSDLAILRVAPHTVNGRMTHVEDVTGGLTLGTGVARKVGTDVTVTGYNDDSDSPIACSTRLMADGDTPVLDCDGFVAGTSGSPWIQTRFKHGTQVTQVIGVIGGRHQGGCSSTISYSSPFGARVAVLFARADAAGPGDTMPTPESDGC